MVKLVESPIDPASVYDSICSAFSGSEVIHYAVVKKQAGSGKSTTSIEYGAQGDTLQELDGIAVELESRWKLEDVLLIRRTGYLAVGDIISLVAASSPNSLDAFEACRHGISRLKKMATIRKTEKFAEISQQKKG
jgi:molybdopterin synthase catalytic subunit